jgi:hypothetical protein
MKKKMKRLALNRDTLVRLEDPKLVEAAGVGTVHPQICCGMSDSCPPPPSAADTTC